jgi:hypothetical protein
MEALVSTNEINNYSVSELNYLRESIENMNKFNQIEVLRILHNHDSVILNENKYGVHVNLSDLKKEILDELAIYIKYVNTQESTLNIDEKQKSDYRNTFFVKDIKDSAKNNIAHD